MDWFPLFISQYGVAAMFLVSFVENIGAPFPAFPVLVLVGAVSVSGQTSFPVLVAGAVLGAIVADGIWYDLGRRRGKKVLSWMCRLSLNPDVCVENSVDLFHRRKTTTILLAKFLPGVNSVMPPLAGVAGLPFSLFLLLDTLGAVLWAVAGTGLGRVFGAEIAGLAHTIQGGMAWVLAAGLAVSVLWAFGYRFYLVKHYATPRIGAEGLYERMRGDSAPIVLDLRRDEYYEPSDRMIEGSFRLRPATFHRFAHHLPRDRDLVFYCT